MKFLRLARKNRAVDPASWDDLYEHTVIRAIRQRYSIDQELAILRQRDTKPEEFEKYNTFAEECKKAVKEEMGFDTNSRNTGV